VAIGAAIAAFLLFQAAFGSWRLAVVQSVALPLTLVGGLIATLFIGRNLSLGALLGLLAVFALAARMGVSMISELQDAEVARPEESREALIQAAARQRLVPVITSILAVAAFAIPFVVLGTRPGLEIVHSLAVVLLGGLLTTALVTLFGLPAIYRQVAPAPAPATEEARA